MSEDDEDNFPHEKKVGVVSRQIALYLRIVNNAPVQAKDLVPIITEWNDAQLVQARDWFTFTVLTMIDVPMPDHVKTIHARYTS